MVGEQPYFEYARALQATYCAKHGYEYVVSNTPVVDRHVNWSKLLAVQGELHDTDWVFCIDADTYFYDMNMPIDSLTHLLAVDQLMLFATDWASKDLKWRPKLDPRTQANCGVFLVKCCESSRKIVDEWMDIIYTHPKWAWDKPLEQEAFRRYILSKYCDRIRVLVNDYHLLNGRDGTFVRHLVGIKGEELLTAMKAAYETCN